MLCYVRGLIRVLITNNIMYECYLASVGISHLLSASSKLVHFCSLSHQCYTTTLNKSSLNWDFIGINFLRAYEFRFSKLAAYARLLPLARSKNLKGKTIKCKLCQTHYWTRLDATTLTIAVFASHTNEDKQGKGESQSSNNVWPKALDLYTLAVGI